MMQRLAIGLLTICGRHPQFVVGMVRTVGDKMRFQCLPYGLALVEE